MNTQLFSGKINANAYFKDVFLKHSWETISESIYSKNSEDVLAALAKENTLTLEDFKALISPAAAPFLELMAQKSAAITRKRFT
jgi:2-iminoacetate synthase